MGILSIIGMLISIGAIVVGILILGGDLMNFLDIPSVMMVIVPTIGAILTTYPVSALAKVPSHMKALLAPPPQPEKYVKTLVDMAQVARSEGLLALESMVANEKDAFMQYGLRLLVDGMDDSTIKYFLESKLDGLNNRHAEASGIYDRAAAYAPAFGMCATVISLINMLMGLDFTDPEAINSLGANMSAALITTFYGSVLANAFFLPISGRLKALHKSEVFCKILICDGVLAIQRGDNPKVLKEMLLEQLSVKIQEQYAKENQ